MCETLAERLDSVKSKALFSNCTIYIRRPLGGLGLHTLHKYNGHDALFQYKKKSIVI